MSSESQTSDHGIRRLLEDLTGMKPPFPCDPDSHVSKLMAGDGIGYSQMNELLLLLGYNRISTAFFQYLVDGTTAYPGGTSITTRGKFRDGVDRFVRLAALRFGNVKAAYQYLSSLATLAEDLEREIRQLDEIPDEEYTRRHDPVLPIEPIPGDQTYYLGYLIEKQLKQKLADNPDDASAKEELKRREQIVADGKQNHEAYLASDHMDVYVATSMRERHEFQIINRVINEVFNNPGLKKLKIRCFDPTQAYCSDRIDKGLAEGLMLKRAKVTLYLVQEVDTLGKDSELASTLAQGKPVVAFIPSVAVGGEAKYVEDLLTMIAPEKSETHERRAVLEQLRIFDPGAAWNDAEVRSWVHAPELMDLTAAKARLGKAIRLHYDNRANTLKKSHPLGLQVNLETGVANGVLVARTTEQCAEVLQRALTNRLEFRLERTDLGGKPYLMLTETITGSIFRVVTGDEFLTNAFWNFYAKK